MLFSVDYTAIAILLGSLLLFAFLKISVFPSSSSPSLAYSRLTDLKYPSWRSRWVHYPKKFHLAALLCLMIAFIDPHLLSLKSSLSNKEHAPLKPIPTEGIAIYLALDRSGSMGQPVETAEENGGRVLLPKIDLLKKVTKKFILAHPSDMIGLVAFARVPQVLVPMTLDQETLLKQLQAIQVVNKPDEDGTAIGYAIYKTANLIAATRHYSEELPPDQKAPYTIKSAAIIVVTDGFQDPSRLDLGNRLRTLELDDAAAFAKSQGIHLYVINIDPALSTAQYAPQRRQLQTVTAETGGKFYFVDDNQQLEDIYQDINKLEKGTIMQEAVQQKSFSKEDYNRFSFYPFFLLLGLGLLLISLLLDSLVLKTVP